MWTWRLDPLPHIPKKIAGVGFCLLCYWHWAAGPQTEYKNQVNMWELLPVQRGFGSYIYIYSILATSWHLPQKNRESCPLFLTLLGGSSLGRVQESSENARVAPSSMWTWRLDPLAEYREHNMIYLYIYIHIYIYSISERILKYPRKNRKSCPLFITLLVGSSSGRVQESSENARFAPSSMWTWRLDPLEEDWKHNMIAELGFSSWGAFR